MVLALARKMDEFSSAAPAGVGQGTGGGRGGDIEGQGSRCCASIGWEARMRKSEAEQRETDGWELVCELQPVEPMDAGAECACVPKAV